MHEISVRDFNGSLPRSFRAAALGQRLFTPRVYLLPGCIYPQGVFTEEDVSLLNYILFPGIQIIFVITTPNFRAIYKNGRGLDLTISKPCWIAFYAVVKIPRPCVNRSGKKFKQRHHLCTRIQSPLLVVDFRSVVHTTQESVTKTYRYPISSDDSLSKPKQHSIAPAQKSSEICVLYVNESPVRYVCGDGIIAIRYSVDI